MDFGVAVILPAAGTGERMNLCTPKQFCTVSQRPVISHTIETFQSIPWVQHIVVVASCRELQYVTDICDRQGHTKVKVTTGASTRHRSICNGVKYLSTVQPACEVVVIHDGVRVFVGTDLLKNVVLEAKVHGAAGVVRPLVSTVIAVDDEGFLTESLDRQKYRASEMPQAFRYSTIQEAYKQCTSHDLDFGTECLHLAQKYAKVKVKLLEGPDYLWKVTHRKDLYALEGVLKERCYQDPVHTVGMSPEDPLVTQLSAQLKQKHIQMKCVDSQDVPNSCQNLVLSTSSTDLTALIGNGLYKDCKNTMIVLLDCRQQRSGNNSLSLLTNVRDTLTKIEQENKNTPRHTIYCGIILQSDETEKAVALMCSLIYDQNNSYSGQVFIV